MLPLPPPRGEEEREQRRRDVLPRDAGERLPVRPGEVSGRVEPSLERRAAADEGRREARAVEARLLLSLSLLVSGSSSSSSSFLVLVVVQRHLFFFVRSRKKIIALNHLSFSFIVFPCFRRFL